VGDAPAVPWDGNFQLICKSIPRQGGEQKSEMKNQGGCGHAAGCARSAPKAMVGGSAAASIC